jgi:hypothetical protein
MGDQEGVKKEEKPEEKKEKKKDVWDKLDVIFKLLSGLLTAGAIVFLGFYTSQKIDKMKADETRFQLYASLMGKREEAESALRKDMFAKIIDFFLKSKPDEKTEVELEEKLLNLELLAFNFHESLNLEPLFLHLKKRIDTLKDKDKKDFLERLYKVAVEITRKQMSVLEGAGERVDRTIDLKTKKFRNQGRPGNEEVTEADLTVGGIKRTYSIHVLKVDLKTREIQVGLEVRTPDEKTGKEEVNKGEFWVGLFDFPMIDHTRLSKDQRCAIVLTGFSNLNGTADISLVCFPGSYAGLKEKPYYEEVLRKLIRTGNLPEESKK